jgi:sugar (pentulose or hexulose) kinase
MLFLGIDISTISSKALLIYAKGDIIDSASSPHTPQAPKPPWSERDPLECWDALCISIQRVLNESGVYKYALVPLD